MFLHAWSLELGGYKHFIVKSTAKMWYHANKVAYEALVDYWAVI